MPRSNSPSPPGRAFFGKIFSILLIPAGAATIFISLHDITRARSSIQWPVVEGVIVESRVDTNRGSKGGASYHAHVRYEYRVGKTLQSGDCVSFGDYDSGDSDYAHQIVNRHPVGQKLDVHHAPDDASISVLEPGSQGRTWLRPGLGMALLAVGLATSGILSRAMSRQAKDAEKKAELSASGQNVADLTVPNAHPKVTSTQDIDGTIVETSGSNLFGGFLIFFAVVQLAVVTTILLKQGAFAFPLPLILVVNALMLTGGALIRFSRYTVTVSSGKITYCFGVAGKGYRKEIARISPMSVTLQPRGVSKNGRQLDAIVVRNADGAEFNFGSFLDDSRKNFLAAHLARLLAPKAATPANPFE